MVAVDSSMRYSSGALTAMHRAARQSHPRSTRSPSKRGALCASLLTLALTAGLLGCSSQVDRHGHFFNDNDLKTIQAGMTRDQVKTQLGTPDTTSTVGGGDAFYYIASKTETVAFFQPTEVDRKVLAVYFNQVGTVDKVANYGLRDGKVINLNSRETPTHASERSLLNQLFRNLGYKQLYGD
jgi:outer membrane protein assembly factor BamE (lipoprotein component of BamABCDE complex)